MTSRWRDHVRDTRLSPSPVTTYPAPGVKIRDASPADLRKPLEEFDADTVVCQDCQWVGSESKLQRYKLIYICPECGSSNWCGPEGESRR